MEPIIQLPNIIHVSERFCPPTYPKSEPKLVGYFYDYIINLYPTARVSKDKALIDFGRTDKRLMKVDLFVRHKHNGLMWLFELRYVWSSERVPTYNTFIWLRTKFNLSDYELIYIAKYKGQDLPLCIKDRLHYGQIEWDLLNHQFKSDPNALLKDRLYYTSIGSVLQSAITKLKIYIAEASKYEKDIQYCAIVYAYGIIFTQYDEAYDLWLKQNEPIVPTLKRTLEESQDLTNDTSLIDSITEPDTKKPKSDLDTIDQEGSVQIISSI